MLIITIGRNKDCDIVIDNEKVSDKHAILYIHDNGEMMIEDNASTNGTYVGERNFPIVMRSKITMDDTLFFSEHSYPVKELLEYIRSKRLGKRKADVERCPFCWYPVEVSRRACPNCNNPL